MWPFKKKKIYKVEYRDYTNSPLWKYECSIFKLIGEPLKGDMHLGGWQNVVLASKN